MVDFTHGDGFHAHRLSETEYRDMLELHLILLLAALATTPRARAAPDPQDGDSPDRTATLSIELAPRSAMGELAPRIPTIADRRHLLRPPQEHLVAETDAELEPRPPALNRHTQNR